MRSFPVISDHVHTPQSRYLFLDFDGVLHTDRPPFDLRFAANLCPIVVDLGLKVVISSTWREESDMPELMAKLGQLGQHVVGMTPVLDFEEIEAIGGLVGRREVEVRLWLNEHANPDADWVAIDDYAFLYFRECPRLFRTDSFEGLSATVANEFRLFANRVLPVATAGA